MYNNTKKNSRKRKRNSVEQITLTTKKKTEPSIIYFVVLSHGAVNFTKSENEDEYKPIHIKIPKDISFFNKITFAPLGINNLTYDEDGKEIMDTLNTELPNIYSKPEGYGKLLANKLKNEHSKVLNIKERLEVEKDLQTRGYYHILNNNKDQFFQSVIYDKKRKNNLPIIQKEFSLDPVIKENKKYDDIFVVFQKGGLLTIGDKILDNDNIFKNYMIHLYNQRNISNIKGDHYIYKPEITTDELLEIAVEYGYEKVVMIDYSCDYCQNIVDTKTNIPRNEIIKWREQVKNKKFGRGGKKRKTVKFLKKLK